MGDVSENSSVLHKTDLRKSREYESSGNNNVYNSNNIATPAALYSP
jgi:hypothetical protein